MFSVSRIKLNPFTVTVLTMHRWFDISAAERDLKYKPVIHYRDGWNETKVWFKKNWLPGFLVTHSSSRYPASPFFCSVHLAFTTANKRVVSSLLQFFSCYCFSPEMWPSFRRARTIDLRESRKRQRTKLTCRRRELLQLKRKKNTDSRT